MRDRKYQTMVTVSRWNRRFRILQPSLSRRIYRANIREDAGIWHFTINYSPGKLIEPTTFLYIQINVPASRVLPPSTSNDKKWIEWAEFEVLTVIPAATDFKLMLSFVNIDRHMSTIKGSCIIGVWRFFLSRIRSFVDIIEISLEVIDHGMQRILMSI